MVRIYGTYSIRHGSFVFTVLGSKIIRSCAICPKTIHCTQVPRAHLDDCERAALLAHRHATVSTLLVLRAILYLSVRWAGRRAWRYWAGDRTIRIFFATDTTFVISRLFISSDCTSSFCDKHVVSCGPMFRFRFPSVLLCDVAGEAHVWPLASSPNSDTDLMVRQFWMLDCQRCFCLGRDDSHSRLPCARDLVRTTGAAWFSRYLFDSWHRHGPQHHRVPQVPRL